jgi:hypothetical protein
MPLWSLIFHTRLKDILCFARDVEFETAHGKKTTLKGALQQAYGKPADLNGYVVLTDDILHLIRHSIVSPITSDLEKVS